MSEQLEFYPEKHLQLAALDWARGHWRYEPISDDVEATGDRMDAIGCIDGRVLVLETKVKVYEATVRFDPHRSGTIEHKIAGTLGPLYAGETRGQPGLIGKHWDRAAPLTIGVLASHYSEGGLAALTTMLDQRSADWRFDYLVWKWTGNQIEQLSQQSCSKPFDAAELSAINVPVMVARPTRQPAATIEDLRVRACERGIGEVFDAILAKVDQFGMKATRRVHGLNLYTLAKPHSLWCSIFVSKADPVLGINCGIDEALLVPAGLPLPGTHAPRAGYLNTNRYIASLDDVETLFAPFASECVDRAS